MTRKQYIGLLVAVAALVALFAFRTPPTPLVEQMPTAEFGGVSLRLEYALNDTEREKGLGGKTDVPEGYGMLFVFPDDDLYGFWMKDTLVPLDMFWIDAQGQVVYIAADVATSTYPNVFYPSAPARYVLETAAGFARAHGIMKGTPLLLKNFPTVTE